MGWVDIPGGTTGGLSEVLSDRGSGSMARLGRLPGRSPVPVQPSEVWRSWFSLGIRVEKSLNYLGKLWLGF